MAKDKLAFDNIFEGNEIKPEMKEKITTLLNDVVDRKVKSRLAEEKEEDEKDDEEEDEKQEEEFIQNPDNKEHDVLTNEEEPEEDVLHRVEQYLGVPGPAAVPRTTVAPRGRQPRGRKRR